MPRAVRILPLLSLATAGAFPQSSAAQPGTANGEWRYYGGDAESTKYSPLDQINRGNAGKLQVAWTWKAQNLGPHGDPNYEVTPLMVHGVLYLTAGMRRDTVVVGSALQLGTMPPSKENVPGYVRGYDVHTGKLLWTFHAIAQPAMLPHATGGANWQGAAADPETGVLYVPSVTNPYVAALVHNPRHSDMNYISKTVFLERLKGLPIVKPPYGRITAIDLNSGDQLWMIPNGQPPDEIKNNPQLKGIDTSKFGNPERALDKKTGDTIFELKLPTHATGVPMTYLAKGKQCIVIAVGGSGEPAELVALSVASSSE